MTALIVAPHPDDAELSAAYLLGSGSTILCLTHADTERGDEAVRAAKVAGCDLVLRDLPDGQLDHYLRRIIVEVELLLLAGGVHLVAGPPLCDEHQDHRATAQAVRSATRRSSLTVVEYETPSTPPGWAPDTFVQLADNTLDRRERALVEHRSQRGHDYVSTGALRARSRRWGQRIGVPHAEAYRTVRRATL